MPCKIHVQRETVVSSYDSTDEDASSAALFEHYSSYTLTAPSKEKPQVVQPRLPSPTKSLRCRRILPQKLQKLDPLIELIALDKKIRAGSAEWERMLREGSVTSDDPRLQYRIEQVKEKYKESSMDKAVRNIRILYDCSILWSRSALLTIVQRGDYRSRR